MKNVNLSHLFLGLNDIKTVEYEVNTHGRGTLYLWQDDENGRSEIVMSIGLNENSGERVAFKIQEPEPVKRGYKISKARLAPTTLASAKRKLSKGWTTAASLRHVTGLSHSSIPTVLTDLRRAGAKIERITTADGSKWRIANV